MHVRRIAAALGATTVSLSAAAVFVAGPARADDPSSSPDPANDPNCTLTVPGDTGSTPPDDGTGATDEPTVDPTDEPTDQPTDQPTDGPSVVPTDDATVDPTDEPTVAPTDTPSDGATEGPVYACTAGGTVEGTFGSGTTSVPVAATLPHTGTPVGSLALLGLTLVAGGSAIVVVARTSRTS